MRTTVEELIAELQTCDPKSHVLFQIAIEVKLNHVQRVDKGIGQTTIVVEKGV